MRKRIGVAALCMALILSAAVLGGCNKKNEVEDLRKQVQTLQNDVTAFQAAKDALRVGLAAAQVTEIDAADLDAAGTAYSNHIAKYYRVSGGAYIVAFDSAEKVFGVFRIADGKYADVSGAGNAEAVAILTGLAGKKLAVINNNAAAAGTAAMIAHVVNAYRLVEEEIPGIFGTHAEFEAAQSVAVNSAFTVLPSGEAGSYLNAQIAPGQTTGSLGEMSGKVTAVFKLADHSHIIAANCSSTSHGQSITALVKIGGDGKLGSVGYAYCHISEYRTEAAEYFKKLEGARNYYKGKSAADVFAGAGTYADLGATESRATLTNNVVDNAVKIACKYYIDCIA